GVVDLLEGTRGRGARVVDQDVDAAVRGEGRGDHRLHVGRPRDVGGLGEHLDPGPLPDRLRGLLQHVLPARADHHVTAFRREAHRGGAAESLAATGDDVDLAGETEIEHGVSSRARILSVRPARVKARRARVCPWYGPGPCAGSWSPG